MKIKFVIAGMIVATTISSPLTRISASSDDFDAVVKIIEQFYHVRHQSIPLLARAGIKATRTAAKIRGGEAKRLAEAGSVRLAFFEDQEFNSHDHIASFKSSIQRILNQSWSPLIATLSAKDEEQTYIYIRDAGTKFHVLIVSIEKREATVVQATVKPSVLEMLLKDPSEAGKAIADDAAIVDP